MLSSFHTFRNYYSLYFVAEAPCELPVYSVIHHCMHSSVSPTSLFLKAAEALLKSSDPVPAGPGLLAKLRSLYKDWAVTLDLDRPPAALLCKHHNTVSVLIC